MHSVSFITCYTVERTMLSTMETQIAIAQYSNPMVHYNYGRVQKAYNRGVAAVVVSQASAG